MGKKSSFKSFRDTCSGFVAMDEETMERHNLQWAKIHVKSNEKVSSKLHVVVGANVFNVQLWW